MKYVKIAVIAVLCVALAGGYYFYLNHKPDKSAEDGVEVTELDEVLSKNLDESYPASPREVVKFYNRIIECAYAGGYSDEQFEQLTNQAQKLMDDELIAENPIESYRQKLKEEVDSYAADKEVIVSTSVCGSDEVVKKTIDGKNCAYVSASYFLKSSKSSTNFSKTYENYLLRQDDDGRWKILAYYLAEGEGETE